MKRKGQKKVKWEFKEEMFKNLENNEAKSGDFEENDSDDEEGEDKIDEEEEGRRRKEEDDDYDR